MPVWTSAQAQAINSKGSILVSASAGTGKTAVLTEKVVNSVLTEDVNIDEMIIMTFSSAAANQMKERIKNRIWELIEDENVDRTKKRILYRQLRKFGDSHIQTIHAFCNELIKKYFYAVNLDPNIRVADVYDVAILKNKAISQVMSLEYEKMDPTFIALEEMIDDTETIEETFVNAYNKIVSFINYKDWLKDAIEKYNIEEGTIPQFLLDMVISDIEKAISNYKEAISGITDANNPKLDKVAETFRYDLSTLEDILQKMKNGSMVNIPLELSDFGATVRFPNGNDYNDIKDLRNEAKDLILSKYKKVNFDFSVQVERIRAMYPILKKFYEIFCRFDEVYISMKNKEKIVDFNDMEKYAYLILQNDVISTDCKNSFKKVFVDEYQDTNPIQEAIIDKITTDDNLFCVGDLKQSIYRFRSSDPTLFLQRSKKYAMNMSLGSIISLNNNFRSAQNVLDCSNDVFNFITSASNEIDYTKDDMLVHGRQDDDAITPVDVHLVSDSFKGNNDLSMEEIEIYDMVKIIKDTIGTPIFDSDTKEYRPAEYKDIVILCRKLTGLTDYLSQIFTANNIPFVIEKAGELLETSEVQTFMNIIDLINNPKNDLQLISVMHLGLFDFSDEDIINIKKNIGKSYYDYMVNLDDNSEISLKCKKMFSFFDDCREKQKYLSLSNLLDYILTNLHLLDIFAVMRNGQKKIANIREFQNIAHDFESKHGEKLFGFSQYIKNIENTNEIVGEAIVNYSENSVKITTIHKSKGLEYPIVILGFAGKQFNKMDRRANIVIDKDCGIGVKYYNHDKKEKAKCMLRTYIEDAIDDKNIEEEMRLLYVAMTRAKEKLYIEGSSSDNANYHSLENISSFLGWVMATLSNSTDFASTYGGTAKIKLVGNWNIVNVDYNDLLPFVSSESMENTPSYIQNRFNIFLSSEEEETLEFSEYVPLVLSASSGLKKNEITENSFNCPDFMKQDKDPMYFGTVTHEFLKNIDFKKCTSLKGVIEEKQRLLDMKIMSKEDLDNIDDRTIFDFFCCELGKFIISCNSYMKEKYINIIENAQNIGYMEENDILVRCIVDLICEKDGQYYLIDYKTDTLNNPNDEREVHQKAMSHKKQLDVYKDALKNMYNIDIKKTYIAFVDYGTFSEI